MHAVLGRVVKHWRWMLGFVVGLLFVAWAMAPIVAELVGAYR